MMNKKPSIPFSQWGVAALFAVLTIVVLYIFVTFAEPDERRPGSRYFTDYSEKPAEAALSEAGLRARLTAIDQASRPDSTPRAGVPSLGRQSGSPGFYQTERLILDAYQAAGLTVTTQQFPVVVPVTEYCEALGPDGQPLPGVTLYPVEPAGMLPTVLPPQGVTGTLLHTESTAPLELAGLPLEGAIVVNNGVDANPWALASMGVKALILTENIAERPADPDASLPWSGITTAYDVPFPRFLARGPIAQYANTPITLRCKVTWQTKSVRNLIGVLPGEPTAKEALVLTSYYDSASVVPDLAPGGEQAMSLAAMLELIRALQPYKGQTKRDIIFVATAGHGQSMEGASRLLGAIERVTATKKSYRSLSTRIAEEERVLADLATGQALLESPAPWAARNADFRTAWMTQDARFRQWFEKQMNTVAGEINLERKEVYLQARLAWIRAGRPTFRPGFDALKATDAARANVSNQHPLMTAYIQEKKAETQSANAIATPFWMWASDYPEECLSWAYRAKALAHLARLHTYHTQRLAEYQDAQAVRTLFHRYRTTLTLNLELYSGGAPKNKDLSVLVGRWNPGTAVEPQSTDLRNTFMEKVPMLGADPAFKVVNYGTRDVAGGPGDPNIHTRLASTLWYNCGWLSYTLVTKNFFPSKIGTPDDVFAGMATDVVAQQLPIISKGLLAIAQGKISFKRTPYNTPARTFRGTVFTSAGTSALVPTHPVGINTFVHAFALPPQGLPLMARGIRVFPIMPVSPYGTFEQKLSFDIGGYDMATVDAARFAADGTLAYFKDASMASQAIFKNELIAPGELVMGNETPVNLAVFRCTQVACFQRGNPKTFNAFPRFDFLLSQGLRAPERIHLDTTGPGISAFLEPDALFYIAMLDGSAQNPEVQTYRAFMFNVDQQAPIRWKPKAPYQTEEPELFGAGYLAADYPNLTFPYFDAAASMLRTNAKRLALQQHYHMADAQMLESQKQGEKWLETARSYREAGDPLSAVNAAGRAFSYAINNHPIIRTKISNAVVGILWYLALLVPFVFFFEKLVFGFTDVRKQLLAVGSIFIAVFGLLQYFHPAFRMVKAPLMILLGFLILLLAIIVAMMVSGRFQQTIKGLRRKEGMIEGADINRGGVVGTAFMLGLNNMRRRKVRTGLTCVTLVLITFVMICFTSVSTDLVDVEYATGRAPANGLMRRDPNFVPIPDSEVSNLRQIFGLRFPVAAQQWLTGKLDPQTLKNAEIFLDREFMAGAQKVSKRAKVNAGIILQANEPAFSKLDKYLLTKHGWFPAPPDNPKAMMAALANGYTPRNFALIADETAKELNISIAQVNAGPVPINIRGEEFLVWGIFDSLNLTSHVGMDGESILPYDLNSLQTLGRSASGAFIVPTTIARFKGSQVVITSKAPAVQSAEQLFTASCSVLFPNARYILRSDLAPMDPVTYKEQRALVAEYLERVGIAAYYAIDGISYYGKRTRARSSEGFLALLIPLLIAAFTVFNTMRGSVYERKDEIYVYNAVGIAPNHIFFMFMAEACVYAVIGAMLGYLLSQITGTVLTSLNLTGGLNMDYSSIETIYASLAIVAAVMLSTIVPAHTASQLALPSDEVSWTVPKADGDTMKFNLPFTFTAKDRVAVISYFYRWLDANGEGSSGSFFSTPPTARAVAGLGLDEGEVMPEVTATIWLKPFDLGVSQLVTISLPTDPETKEFIAQITIVRSTGTIAAWNRTIMPFLVAMRKQFLNWRAVSDSERQEMFDEAQTLLTQSHTGERETVNV
jgi:hypothetical protein